MATEEQGSWSGFDCSIFRKSMQYDRPQPCTLVAATISDDENIDVMRVPCFYCDAEHHKNKEDYYEHYNRQFLQQLVWAYPGLSGSGAHHVSEHLNLRCILQEANAGHGLSCRTGKKLTLVHMVRIHIQPTVEDEMEYEHEDAGSKMKPASASSVRSLVARKWVSEESAWRASECAICMEEIETWGKSLAMDCGHVFHQECLCRWLSTSHVCPLCRYQMPTH